MTDINIAFCRRLLSEITKDLKKHFPEKRVVIDAWVWNAGRDHWEFHGPALTPDAGEFYWHGSASNAYEARYKGWSAWLQAKGIDLDTEVES